MVPDWTPKPPYTPCEAQYWLRPLPGRWPLSARWGSKWLPPCRSSLTCIARASSTAVRTRLASQLEQCWWWRRGRSCSRFLWAALAVPSWYTSVLLQHPPATCTCAIDRNTILYNCCNTSVPKKVYTTVFWRLNSKCVFRRPVTNADLSVLTSILILKIICWQKV